MIGQFTELTVKDWRDSPEYQAAAGHLQKAEWAAAMPLLSGLLVSYPDDPDLERVLAETQLHIETDSVYRSRHRGLKAINRRFLVMGGLLFVLAGLAYCALFLYQNVVQPANAQIASGSEQHDMASQAQQALASGDHETALAIYDRLAAINPDYPNLLEYRNQARQAKALAEAYELAMAQLAAGNLPDAQATLNGIKQIMPNYRDVGNLLVKIDRQQRVNGLLRQAADAVAAQNWEEVVARLEEARPLVPAGDRASIDADLFDAYLNLAQGIVNTSAGRPQELDRAVDVYGRALSLRPQHAQAAAARAFAQDYLQGYAAIKNGDWEGAVLALEPLYAAMPAYLDGEAVRLLYNAYMRSGDLYFGLQQPEVAWERYYRASQLAGIDTSTARALAARLVAYVTPTPMPVAPPTATPAAPSLKVPAPTVNPGGLALARLRGKIVFTSTRSGAANLWVMDPDGKNAFMMGNQAAAQEEFRALAAAEARSPDGQRTAFVTTPPNETNPQVFTARSDNSTVRLTDLAGMNAEPVWSPGGFWIAFVSNQPGNDEIFVVGSDGKNLKRLTNNTFEWDKHPSWSPDGSQLAYWSNQSGQPQIWVMHEDGTGATNLSHNAFEERDPLWIK